MEFLPQLYTVIIVHFIAAVTPGPDFLLVSRNALFYSRKTGYFTSAGIAVATFVHMAYCLLGLGILLTSSTEAFTAIKLFGAAYIMYIGYKSLTAHHPIRSKSPHHKKRDIPHWFAFKMGFITDLTNPYAILFYIALFSNVIDPQTPLTRQLIFGSEMAIVNLFWYSFVAYIFSLKIWYLKISHMFPVLEKLMGVLLIIFGIKIALANM